MARIKERKKILHQAGTKEYLVCLSYMPEWCKILKDNTNNSYSNFLQFLLSNNFCMGTNDKVHIKDIATKYGAESSKISKWLAKIYEDINDLNYEKPELFKTEGIKHELYFTYFDNQYRCTMWLQTTPRIYEGFDFYFARAALGFNTFYVENVTHSISENEHSIEVFLKGGFVNRYREMLVDKGQFYGVLNLFNMFHQTENEIDDILKKYYKH